MTLVISARSRERALSNPPRNSSNKDREIDINSIVQRSARVTEADLDAAAQYDFYETDWEADGSHKTYAVQMVYGSPYRQLVARDGHPLPKKKQQEEERKLREEIFRRAHETTSQRTRRIAEQQKENTRDRRFIEEFVWRLAEERSGRSRGILR